MSKDKVHIDDAKKRPERPEYCPDDRCPRCGAEIEIGFGLAGGGYGVYTYCPKCEVVTSKTEVHE